jgi:hypothetical protein
MLGIQVFWDVTLGHCMSGSCHVFFKAAQTFKTSETTHPTTQCQIRHNTAVSIGTLSRKYLLATASLAFTYFFFSCFPLPP